MLKLQIIGYLGRDAEVREVGGNNVVISFSVAYTEKYKDRNGVLQEKTTWVRCSLWRQPDKTAVAQYLTKGTQVFVEGVPSANAYLSKEDNKPMASLECRVSNLELLGSRGSGGGGADYAAGSSSQEPQAYAPSGSYASAAEDDLPF
jgi:single-strand DNA-binding protein